MKQLVYALGVVWITAVIALTGCDFIEDSLKEIDGPGEVPGQEEPVEEEDETEGESETTALLANFEIKKAPANVCADNVSQLYHSHQCKDDIDKYFFTHHLGRPVVCCESKPEPEKQDT